MEWPVERFTLLCRQSMSERGGEMTRATAFGNRTISGQRRDLEGGAESETEDDETGFGLEMAAMAKVWAHPEDLHKYPVSPEFSSHNSHLTISFFHIVSLIAERHRNSTKLKRKEEMQVLRSRWIFGIGVALHLLKTAQASRVGFAILL